MQIVVWTAWYCQTLLQVHNGQSQPVFGALARLMTGANRNAVSIFHTKHDVYQIKQQDQ